LTDGPLDRNRELIEYLWRTSGAGPGLVEAMRQVLPGLSPGAGQGTVRWVALPNLCCQAAGGDPRWADPLAAAWFLLYTAAHLMDKVEDQDEPEPSWASLGSGGALNAATGLFFTASLALNQLYHQDQTRRLAPEAVDDFYGCFLRMSAGQQADLSRPEPNLEQYWETARDKSGAFFQAACLCGARLAEPGADRLEAFSRYGLHLGLLKQVLDDLEDIHPPEGAHLLRLWPDIARSLAVVYAMSVYPASEGERLRQYLQDAGGDPSAAQEAYRLLEKSGAALYLSMEIERHHGLAAEAAVQAAGSTEAAQPLVAMVDQLASPRGRG
jgi:geranylgeranyl pyrophosphate synthase